MPRVRAFGEQTLRTRLMLEAQAANKAFPKKRKQIGRPPVPIRRRGNPDGIKDYPYMLRAVEIETGIDRVLMFLPVVAPFARGEDPEIVHARRLLVFCAKRYTRVQSEELPYSINTVTAVYKEFRLKCTATSVQYDFDLKMQVQRIHELFVILRKQERIRNKKGAASIHHQLSASTCCRPCTFRIHGILRGSGTHVGYPYDL